MKQQNSVELESRKPYAQPVLVKQGRVEDLTQDNLEQYFDCSKPVQ
jgi:hypothetical protein